jgi:tellurium resistance protein TerD
MTVDPNTPQAGDASHMHKGEEVDLTNLDAGLRRVIVGLGWDAPESKDGHPVDVDASAFILNRDNRVRRDTDFVFYNNLETESGAIKHKGDNTSGLEATQQGGAEDAEVIEMTLEGFAFDVEKIAFAVTIHNAEERGQTFGLVKNAYMRVVNVDTGRELARFDLTEDAGADNAIVFGELIRDGINWKFKAIGTSSKGGLYKIAREFGVNVAPN